MSKVLAFVFGVFAICAVALPARADVDYAAINTALAEEVIIPAYVRMADATGDLERDWADACANPDGADMAKARADYHRVADAWAQSFHWNFGPITLLLRRDRFYHWPERRNSISKSLNDLLAEPDESRIQPDTFPHISVAAQGLPAMERMLFERADVFKDAWSCKVGYAIARNLHTMAQGTVDEWTGDVVEVLRKGEEHPIYFDDPESTLNKMFTELLAGFTILRDQKIAPVLGASVKRARPNMAEARRSNRFERNLQLNLQILLAADDVMARYLPDAPRKILEDHRNAIVAQAEALPPIVDAVYDENGRKAYMALSKALGDFRADMVKAYTKHLGLVVGFNSLDGD